MKIRNLVMCISCLSLTACGTMPEERAVSGAGVGAAAGAILGAVTGLSVVQGAVIGALGGGLTGAMTRNDQINLGEPTWKQGARNTGSTSSIASGPASSSRQAIVASIQGGLKELGYDPGPVDGLYGTRTAGAIRKYQRDQGLRVDGQATAALADHIRNQQS